MGDVFCSYVVQSPHPNLPPPHSGYASLKRVSDKKLTLCLHPPKNTNSHDTPQIGLETIEKHIV